MAPQKIPWYNLWNMWMLPYSTIEKKFCRCDMIKLWVLKWEHYSGLSGKPLRTVTCKPHKKKVEGGFTHTRVCARTQEMGNGEKKEKEALWRHRQRLQLEARKYQWPPEDGRGKGWIFLEPPDGAQSYWHLDFGSVILIADFRTLNLWEIKFLLLLSHHTCGTLLQ